MKEVRDEEEIDTGARLREKVIVTTDLQSRETHKPITKIQIFYSHLSCHQRLKFRIKDLSIEAFFLNLTSSQELNDSSLEPSGWPFQPLSTTQIPIITPTKLYYTPYSNPYNSTPQAYSYPNFYR